MQDDEFEYKQLESQVGPAPKEKRTRRRLRLSCVECTKRRQKCDRQTPCGLCKTRGVEHLCRWENAPVSRPAPARPPVMPEALPYSAAPTLDETKDKLIQELQAKVVSLEQRIEDHKFDNPRHHSSYSSSSPSIASSSSPGGSRSSASTNITTPSPSPVPIYERQLDPDDPPGHTDTVASGLYMDPLCHLGPNTYAETSLMSQLCLSQYGEFVGRGSSVCALHFISTHDIPRFLVANNSRPISPERTADDISPEMLDRMERLFHRLPARDPCMDLARRFFAESNYLFGIPDVWFARVFHQMWDLLEQPGPHGMQVNPNFLVLLFAILAYTPDLGPNTHTSPQEREQIADGYFRAAVEARRIAEDNHLFPPNCSLTATPADGTVLTCIAIPILAAWLSQRGKMSEGWKMVGQGVRSALSLALHRDPKWEHWRITDEDEITLRRIAWWGLFTRDKIYSFLLGRQHGVRGNSYDVKTLPTFTSDGHYDVYGTGLSKIIDLAELAGRIIETCFSKDLPDHSVYLKFDNELIRWEQDLPQIFRLQLELADKWRKGTQGFHGYRAKDLQIVRSQGYLMLTWCLWMRMKLHVSCLVRPNLPRETYDESSKRCIDACLRLGHMQCDTYDHSREAVGLRPLAYNVAAGPEAYPPNNLAYHQPYARPPSTAPPTLACFVGHCSYPGPIWFFEGCFSLVEAATMCLAVVTRHPWKSKLKEVDTLTARVISVLEDVKQHQDIQQGSTARLGVVVLRKLLKEEWWTSQRLGQEPTVVAKSENYDVGGLLSQPHYQNQAVVPGGYQYSYNAGYDTLASASYTQSVGVHDSTIMY